MKVGAEFELESVVKESMSARCVGSGDMDVLATPAMAALMERAAMLCVAESLEQGTTTVGTELSVSHLRATAIGKQIKAKAVLRIVDGRRLTFTVSATDDKGLIGEGGHVRYIVSRDKFLAKL